MVLGLAYVMNFSGMTISIGQFLAHTGSLFALLSPVLGWVGTAVTGSDTSANALFSSLQYEAAQSNASLTHVSPDLFLAANTMGGVIGKMMSPRVLGYRCRYHRRTRIEPVQEGHPLERRHVGCSLCAGVCKSSVLSFILP